MADIQTHWNIKRKTIQTKTTENEMYNLVQSNP